MGEIGVPRTSETKGRTRLLRWSHWYTVSRYGSQEQWGKYNSRSKTAKKIRASKHTNSCSESSSQLPIFSVYRGYRGRLTVLPWRAVHVLLFSASGHVYELRCCVQMGVPRRASVVLVFVLVSRSCLLVQQVKRHSALCLCFISIEPALPTRLLH